ncbi:MAG: alpha/beta hydrolase [Myxococcota bacterium]|jgi:acetyl esterase/lipase|nr:alpha/beta hydrolase [Myxococcota bacterium]
MAVLTILAVLFAAIRITLWTTVRRWVRGPRLPAWSWAYEVVVGILRWGARRNSPRMVGQLRRVPPMPLVSVLRRHVQLEEGELAGRPVLTVQPHAWQPSDPTVLYFHGGGYVTCSPGTHRALLARIALAGGARCVALDYRLAPEEPYPAALEDALAACRALRDQGVAPGQLILGGDSAGGGLSMAVLLRLRELGEALPAGAVLLSPWVDLTHQGDSIESCAETDYLGRDVLEYYARLYVDEDRVRDPMVSPVFADLEGLCPLLVQAGGAEVLRDQVRGLADRAEAAGVDTRLEIYPDMVHVWHVLSPLCPEGQTAIRRIGEFVAEVCD